MEEYVLIGLIVLLGGIVQGLCGFGAGLVCMPLMTLVVDYEIALAIMYISTLVLNVRIIGSMWKYVKWKLITLPIVFSFFGRIVALMTVVYLPQVTLKLILGALIVATAFYQMWFADKIRIKANAITGGTAGLLSGFFGGMASTGGPPMVVYFMSMDLEKYRYIANLQMTFFFGSIMSVVLMGANGRYLPGSTPFVLIGAVMMTIGATIGLQLFKKVKIDRLKIIINWMLVLTGVFLLVQTVLSMT